MNHPKRKKDKEDTKGEGCQYFSPPSVRSWGERRRGLWATSKEGKQHWRCQLRNTVSTYWRASDYKSCVYVSVFPIVISKDVDSCIFFILARVFYSMHVCVLWMTIQRMLGGLGHCQMQTTLLLHPMCGCLAVWPGHYTGYWHDGISPSSYLRWP